MSRLWYLLLLWRAQQWKLTSGFVPPDPLQRLGHMSIFTAPLTKSSARYLSSASGYSPPQEDERGAKPQQGSNKAPLYPKAGDFVLYYDLDGGKEQGQVLVGRIRFIQKNIGNEGSGWTLELTEMEPIAGEDEEKGYYTDYSSRQRWAKGSTYRDLAQVRPLSASFVRSQDAYKIPTRASDGSLIPKAERYDVEGYEGPFADPENAIDTAVVEADQVLYQALKGKLLKYAALAGAAGTVVADLLRGTESAAIYFAGVAASLLYLLFLSLKTDTLGTERAGFGKNVSNLRFVMPVLVMVGVAVYNTIRGDFQPFAEGGNLFQTVTPEQFAAAVLGFLTYRLPLLFIQVEGAVSSSAGEDEGLGLPGSAGVAMQLARGQQEEDAATGAAALDDASTGTTVFLISGPQSTGRNALVQQLLDTDDESKFVTPTLVDKLTDGATFERLDQRGEFLEIDQGRYGLTRQALLDAGKQASTENQILVVNADVELAKKLSSLSGLRLVGVWVGLGSVQEFEQRLKQQVDQGLLPVEEGETKDSTVRGKIREIVKEIEYGISSGIFEFTVLNDDAEKSLKQLREASNYVN